MNTLYVYLLVSIIVGIYTYYDIESYSCKETRITHVFLNMSLTIIFIWFISILVQVIINTFGK